MMLPALSEEQEEDGMVFTLLLRIYRFRSAL